VHALVERARDAGLAVELRVEGEPGPLPAGIDLAAFRVMQDTLEEIVKHASGQTAVAIVRYTPDDLELTFDLDDVGDFAPAGNAGLLGARERVAMYGGKAWAGPREAGGYRLYARLPRAFEEIPA
jgi:signal transduction histidine kinase